MNKPNPQHKYDRKTTIKRLIEFIEKELHNFPNSQEFIDILKLKKNENQHTQAFSVFMQAKCRSKYSFQREVAQKGSYTVDIGVYKGSLLIFVIEAKILPTPKGDRKEYEYVYGKGGAIQRFKDNKHGLDDKNNLLEQNAIIAYIKKETFEHWFDKINEWILEAGWCVEECLTPKYLNQNDKHLSRHTRIDNTALKLHHFWVKVT
ncbi:hypothetical protein [Hugenholtzia roseola]|uniref:hypothetical protein n=1 Tax=Hugenholtzia roseola TaxID=1002 RepID=UPI00040B29D4|nr:hypothetical protein [Hugenholtzia roseola]